MGLLAFWLDAQKKTMNTPTYEVLHACGHTAQAIDCVPEDQRHLYPHRGTSTAICKPCWITQTAATRFVDSTPLPALIGTEARVAWAESIRRHALLCITDAIGVCKSRKMDKQVQHHMETYKTLRGVRSASRWIDARHMGPAIFAAKLVNSAATRKTDAQRKALLAEVERLRGQHGGQ